MATRKHYDPSQEQLALAKARKEKKMNKGLVTKDSDTLQLLSRRWLSLPHAHPKKSGYQQVKIMTWNVCRLLLATCISLNPCRKQAPCTVLDKYEIESCVISRLILQLSPTILAERELFPTSDCLKAAQREPMIHEEILKQDADIICLQVSSENSESLPWH